MGFDLLTKYKFTRKLLLRLSISRAKQCINSFISYIDVSETVLDIGSGVGIIAEQLNEAGRTATALDIKNLSLSPKVNPLIYDGNTVPFNANAFDTALLHTVLHHIPNPKQTLKEAARVARKVIIVEDVYSGFFHKYLTFFVDSVTNLEFKNHPHSNKTDEQWRRLFDELGYELMATGSKKSLLVMRHKLYVLNTAANTG